jgi:hypothetical protein
MGVGIPRKRLGTGERQVCESREPETANESGRVNGPRFHGSVWLGQRAVEGPGHERRDSISKFEDNARMANRGRRAHVL